MAQLSLPLILTPTLSAAADPPRSGIVKSEPISPGSGQRKKDKRRWRNKLQRTGVLMWFYFPGELSLACPIYPQDLHVFFFVLYKFA
jgi:hypothetical protein